MDPLRFDSLVRTLGGAASRRRALIALLGSLAVPLLPGLEADAGRKQRQRRGKRKDRDDRRDHETRQESHKGRGKGKNSKRRKQPSGKPAPVEEAKPACREEGHPCEGNQECCNPGITICVASGPGAAERCTACPDGQIACANNCIDACTASGPCHVAGECDPTTGACTDPKAEDGAACDDGDACTRTDVCRDGECVGKDPVVCTAADECHDAGTCDPATGKCSNPRKPDGASCSDNSSCTTGDSCQNGICTPGVGVDCSHESDECNDGVCRESDGTCLKRRKDNGTPCGAGGECVGGVCETICLPLSDRCNPADNRCCDAGCGALAPNCYATGVPQDERCCRDTRGACGNDCDCCGLSACESSACCRHAGGACESKGDCCQNVVGRQACVAGRCCALDGEPCEGPNDCCDGLCGSDGICTGCLALQETCEDDDQCCQGGGVTNCEPSCDFDTPTCCHPPGGACTGNCDCCGGQACCNGVCCGVDEECVDNTCRGICRQHDEICTTGQCCAGLECRAAPFVTGRCRDANCKEFRESCGGSETRPCCEGECQSDGLSQFCCSPEGGQCGDLGRFFPGGDCCGSNVCNGAGRCARCRSLNETCDGIGTASNCCNTPFGGNVLLCDQNHTGVCIKCPTAGEPCFDDLGGKTCCDNLLCGSDGLCG